MQGCKKRYTSVFEIMKHYKDKHVDSGKRHQCSTCSRKQIRSDVVRHERSRHQETHDNHRSVSKKREERLYRIRGKRKRPVPARMLDPVSLSPHQWSKKPLGPSFNNFSGHLIRRWTKGLLHQHQLSCLNRDIREDCS